jgi:hypothetical protein
MPVRRAKYGKNMRTDIVMLKSSSSDVACE